ncbi:hypothetical protein D9M72_383120 [compost metagenome]
MFDPGGARIAGHPDAAVAQAGGQHRSAAAVDVPAQRVRSVVDHGHRGTLFGGGQGCLESQDAAAQHHNALAAGNSLAEHLGVAQVAQRGHAGGQYRVGRVRVEAGQVGDDRTRTGGKHQPVIAGLGAVREDHLLAGAVHPADADAEPDVHTVGDQRCGVGQCQRARSGATDAEVCHQHAVVGGVRFLADHGQVGQPAADGGQQLIDQSCGNRTKANNYYLLTHEASDV